MCPFCDRRIGKHKDGSRKKHHIDQAPSWSLGHKLAECEDSSRDGTEPDHHTKTVAGQRRNGKMTCLVRRQWVKVTRSFPWSSTMTCTARRARDGAATRHGTTGPFALGGRSCPAPTSHAHEKGPCPLGHGPDRGFVRFSNRLGRPDPVRPWRGSPSGCRVRGRRPRSRCRPR